MGRATSEDIAAIHKIIEPLHEFPLFDIYSDKDDERLNLTFSRDETEDASDTSHDWHLWAWGCSWRLENSTGMILGCGDKKEKKAAILDSLSEQSGILVLTSMIVTAPAFDVVLKFNNDLTIKLFPERTRKYRHWALFTPSRKVLLVGPGCSWEYKDRRPRQEN